MLYYYDVTFHEIWNYSAFWKGKNISRGAYVIGTLIITTIVDLIVYSIHHFSR
jgi:hypothetical protein